MIDKKLKEALELLGGKALINDGQEVYVMMNLREFRKLRTEGTQGLTKQELIDRINNDIASWKFSQEQKKIDKLELEEIRNIDDLEIRYEKTV
jgi:hypothetical protein